MIEISINNIGDLRQLTLAELAYSIFNSISIDFEYAILSAWHLLHYENLQDRVYNRIASIAGDPRKIKKFAKIPKKYCDQLFNCYSISRVSDHRVSLIPRRRKCY